MPSFRYTALTAAGERVAGVLAGGSEQAVLAELETRRLTPVAVAEQREARAASFGRRVSARQLATAYTQLADLLRAGVPLLRGLRLLGARKSAPALSKVFGELADAVAEGTELAEAMGAHPEVFGTIHVAMVRAGEKGGFLEGVLARLGQFLHGQAELRSKVVGNMIYPAVLVVFGTLVMGLVFGYFIPMFRPIFAGLEADGKLNILTRSVLGLSVVIRQYGLLALAGLVAAIIAAWRASKVRAVRAQWEAVKVAMPVVGSLIRALAAARFCRILGTLLGNSIPMLSAMQIARQATGNALMEAAIERATEAVRQGQSLAPPLAESGLFDDDIIEMISVGESANNLADVLVTIAETLEQRIDRQLSVAVKLIEPLMLVALALVVGLVAIALIVPMTQLSQQVK